MPSKRTSAISTCITSVQAEMHDDLGGDNALEALAARSGYSPFHFHRNFVASVGETPKQHVLRIRLERAAYLIAITDQRVLAIAFEMGFQSHESFTRAFRRHFQMSPTRYRAHAKAAQAERLVRNKSFTGDGCVLSPVRFLTLPATTLLCVRHTGAYSAVTMPPFGNGDALWLPLRKYAGDADVAPDGTAWSICYDNPAVTPGPQQRLDACIGIPRPIATTGLFRCLDFEGGLYAGIEHIGPHETISQAYAHVADAIRTSDVVTFGTGALVQIFRHIASSAGRHRTEVYFPVVRA